MAASSPRLAPGPNGTVPRCIWWPKCTGRRVQTHAGRRCHRHVLLREDWRRSLAQTPYRAGTRAFSRCRRRPVGPCLGPGHEPPRKSGRPLQRVGERMTTHRVTTSREHIQALAKATPIQAVEELIWNGLDAGGDVVEVRLHLTQGPLKSLEGDRDCRSRGRYSARRNRQRLRRDRELAEAPDAGERLRDVPFTAERGGGD